MLHAGRPVFLDYVFKDRQTPLDFRKRNRFILLEWREQDSTAREVAAMAEIRCEKVSRGMREEERTVTVRDAVSGLRSFLRVETEFLTYQDGKYYLPVGVVQEEPQRGLALVELPQEPDAGNTRLWVRTADFLQDSRAPT